MAAAMVYPEPAKAHRGKKSEYSKLLEAKAFSSDRLWQARTVLRHSEKVAAAVLARGRSGSAGVAATAFPADPDHNYANEGVEVGRVHCRRALLSEP